MKHSKKSKKILINKYNNFSMRHKLRFEIL